MSQFWESISNYTLSECGGFFVALVSHDARPSTVALFLQSLRILHIGVVTRSQLILRCHVCCTFLLRHQIKLHNLRLIRLNYLSVVS